MTRRRSLLAAIILPVILWAFTLWILHDPPKIRRPEWTPQEKQWVLERMKHHGIWCCEFDGEIYTFIREGKRCRL